MKQELKDKWVISLCSGEYKQGLTNLKSVAEPTTWCCLGVLADIIDPDNWKTVQLEHVSFKINMNSACEPTGSQFIHDNILEWEIQRRLAELNDRGEPFTKIANWIEQNIKGE